MSNKEIERYRILYSIKDNQITQLKGAEMLNLSTRQVRNLLTKLKIRGANGLISKLVEAEISIGLTLIINNYLTEGFR